MYEMLKHSGKPDLHGGAAFGVAWKDLMPSLRNAWNSEAYDEDKRVNRKVYERSAMELAASDQSTPIPPLRLRAVLTEATSALNSIVEHAQTATGELERGDLADVDLREMISEWNSLVAKINPLVIGPANVGMSDEDTNALHNLVSTTLLQPLETLQTAAAGRDFPGKEAILSKDIAKNILLQVQSKYYKAVPYGERTNRASFMPREGVDEQFPGEPSQLRQEQMALDEAMAGQPRGSVFGPIYPSSVAQPRGLPTGPGRWPQSNMPQQAQQPTGRQAALMAAQNFLRPIVGNVATRVGMPGRQNEPPVGEPEPFYGPEFGENEPRPQQQQHPRLSVEEFDREVQALKQQALNNFKQYWGEFVQTFKKYAPQGASPLPTAQAAFNQTIWDKINGVIEEIRGGLQLWYNSVEEAVDAVNERLNGELADYEAYLRGNMAAMAAEGRKTPVQREQEKEAERKKLEEIKAQHAEEARRADERTARRKIEDAELAERFAAADRQKKDKAAAATAARRQQEAAEEARASEASPREARVRQQPERLDPAFESSRTVKTNLSAILEKQKTLVKNISEDIRLKDALLDKLRNPKKGSPNQRTIGKEEAALRTLQRDLKAAQDRVESFTRKLAGEGRAAGKGRWTDYSGPVMQPAPVKARMRGGNYRDTPNGNTESRAIRTSNQGSNALPYDDEDNDPNELGDIATKDEMIGGEMREAYLDPDWKGLPKRWGIERRIPKLRKGYVNPKEKY